VVLYFILLLRSDRAMMTGLEAQKAAIEREIKASSAERVSLKKEIKLLDDPNYVELLAREKLGLIKRSESAFKVVK
jgi:cell division protein FtsB